MALLIYEVLFKDFDKTIFSHNNVPVIVSEKQPLCNFYEKKKKDKRSFYFKHITIRVEFSELVWTRKCLDSILSSLSPRSGLNIYTLSRSCDAPLLSRALLSPLPGFKPSPPAQPSSRIWPRIAPGGYGAGGGGGQPLNTVYAVCADPPNCRVWNPSHSSLLGE